MGLNWYTGVYTGILRSIWVLIYHRQVVPLYFCSCSCWWYTLRLYNLEKLVDVVFVVVDALDIIEVAKEVTEAILSDVDLEEVSRVIA